jgi:uncharacterized protein YcfJ
MNTVKALSLGLALMIGASTVTVGAADARTCHRERSRAHAGTAIGAIAGGLIGNGVAHGGGRLGGTLIGAGAGAVVGHQIGKHSVKCSNHGYYYSHGKRHYY